MAGSSTDEGLIEVILERLEKQRLPRLLEIKAKVDGGNLLADFDVDFLQQSMADAKNMIPIIDRQPEYQALAAKVMDLYKEISETALKLEKES